MRLTKKEIAIKYKVNESNVERAFATLDNRKSVLFAMSGKMGAGKDTIGDKVAENIRHKDFEIIKTSYATPLRQEISEIAMNVEFGITFEELSEMYEVTEEELFRLIELMDGESIYTKTAGTRRAIQFWGTDVRRKQDPNYWVNKIVKIVLDTINDGKSIYVTDARFTNEVDAIVDLGGKVLRLDVPTSVRSDRIGSRDGNRPTEDSLEHSSEMGLDDYEFTAVFDGCGNPDNLGKELSEFILI